MALKATELCVIVPEGEAWVGEIRRRLVRLAESVGFSEEKCSDVALVATEMATNLEKHRAVLPIIRYGVTESDLRGRGLLMISEDRGPGIANPERAIGDHYSTAGTMGGGLGAIQRHSDEFSLASGVARSGQPHPGTVVISRHWLPRPGPQGPLDCEILTRAKPGETENGDGASFSEAGDHCQIAVIDGLGHGADAFKATEEIRQIFQANPSLSLTDLMERAHRAMHGGRGAVAGILRLNRREARALYAGVGNIDCRIYGKHPARPVSMNGSIGVVFPRCREESYPFGQDDFFVMASDGVSSRWEPESYPQFPRLPFVTRAALIFRDYSRTTDDATVAVGGFTKK